MWEQYACGSPSPPCCLPMPWFCRRHTRKAIPTNKKWKSPTIRFSLRRLSIKRPESYSTSSTGFPTGSSRGAHEATFDFAFTQEWPVGRSFINSHFIPFSKVTEREGGRLISQEEGIGDILLNYRLQVLDGEGGTVAFSPRFSVILPTGDEEKGLGNGVVGYQVNLPFSRQLEDRAYHFNAGFTVTPNVVAGVDPALGFTGGTLHGYNLGGSAIKFVRPDFHLMLEVLALWDESLLEDQTTDGSIEVFVSPGFRWAAYTEGETQLVLGTAVPIGLTRDTPDVSVFLYLSFEHRFRPKD